MAALALGKLPGMAEKQPANEMLAPASSKIGETGITHARPRNAEMKIMAANMCAQSSHHQTWRQNFSAAASKTQRANERMLRIKVVLLLGEPGMPAKHLA